MVIISLKLIKKMTLIKKNPTLKKKLLNKKYRKPKLLTDAYKDLLDDYKVDYKDRDIKKLLKIQF